MTSASTRYRSFLKAAHGMLAANIETLTLDEALFADGGYRSILGVLKHVGGWGRVYHSYAFASDPKHWDQTAWPRGLRDEIEPSKDYVDEVIAWIDDTMKLWDADLSRIDDAGFDDGRPVHWGATMPLSDIVTMVANHVVYHTGELNMLLSIARGEAWEWGEEVEENHIDTYGHGVRGPWMNDEIAAYYEDRLRRAHEQRAKESS